MVLSLLLLFMPSPRIQGMVNSPHHSLQHLHQLIPPIILHTVHSHCPLEGMHSHTVRPNHNGNNNHHQPDIVSPQGVKGTAEHSIVRGNRNGSNNHLHSLLDRVWDMVTPRGAQGMVEHQLVVQCMEVGDLPGKVYLKE